MIALPPYTVWAVVFTVGVPAIFVVLTELIAVLSRRGHPMARPVRLLRNGVFPVGALLVLLTFAVGTPGEHVWVRVVATLFGFLTILLVLSAFNVMLFSTAETGSWRRRIPSIFVEIARLVLVAVGVAMLFSWVWGADVGGLIAALGVTSIVIGLALQNAVGGVISGLLLLFEQPFKLGDHLLAGGVRGRVKEVNWRAVHIETASGIEIIPNATLAAASFTNLSEPVDEYAASVTVAFSTDDPPYEVMRLLVEVADALPLKAPNVQPAAQYEGNGSYSVSIPLSSPAHDGAARSQYLGWLWYAARRHELALDGDDTDPLAAPEAAQAAIEFVAPILHLQEDERELLRQHARLYRYGTGETVLRPGVVPDAVSMVVSGAATMSLDAGGVRLELCRVEPGEIIGHTALTREHTQTTTSAVEELTLLTISLATLDSLVQAHPRLAGEIGGSLDMRRRQAQSVIESAGLAERVSLTSGV